MAAIETNIISQRPPMKESESLSKFEALRQLKAGRTGEAAEPATNPVSEAARTLALSKRLPGQPKQPLQAPAVDKPAPQKTAPIADKPEEEAEDNSAETAEPEGQGVSEEQSQEGQEAEAEESDGSKEPTITIDGEKLTAQEIRDSYLRREDYSRKTAEVAERRKVLDATLGNVTQNSQRLEQLVGLLEQAVGQEPDWATLAMQMQPQQYLAYKENWNQQKAVLQNVRAEREKTVTQSIQQAKAAMFDEFAREFRPEWQDRLKMQEGVSKLADFAVSMGITPEELQFLHRTPMLRILDMAFEQHTLKTSQRITDKRVQGKPKPVRPGVQRSPGHAAETQLQAERQLWESNKSPTTKDSLRWLNAKRAYEQATGKRA